MEGTSGSIASQGIEVLIGRRIHWFEWMGIACGLAGLFFGFRNYVVSKQTSYQERSFVGFLVKMISRNID